MKTFFNKVYKWISLLKDKEYLNKRLITGYLRKKPLVTSSIIFITIIAIAICAIAIHGRKLKEIEKAALTLDSEINKIAETVDDQEALEENDDDEGKGKFLFPPEGKRPFAVMIDNEGTKCLPQGGLDKAQVIYDIIVEGGETRFMPLFWETEPELIGPVRSSRHYFLDYALEHDAIYVHFGWSPLAMKDIPKLGINNINGVANGGEIFWDLTNDPGNWQDSYTSTEKIKGYIERAKYKVDTEKKPVFTYNMEDIVPKEGSEAREIEIQYNYLNVCGYLFDDTTGEYSRLRKGKPHIERETEEQLKAKNIIIQFVKNYTIPGDKEDRQEVETVGMGDGWYITCGRAIEIEWLKETREGPTEYKDKHGDIIKLNPGQTWVQIVPLYGKIEIN